MTAGTSTRLAAAAYAPPLLEVQGARVVRDGRTILDIERFQIREGEHMAILGPNGAGKTTLIGLLTREVAPLWSDPYPLRFRGEDLVELAEVRRAVGVVSSAWQSVVAVHLTVSEVVLGGLFGALGIPPHRRDLVTEKDVEAADAALEELGIAHLAQRDMTTLSTGEARRALIARAIVHDPAVLVLDEPAAGLDPTAAWHLRALMRELTRGPRALVLVTHHIEDVVEGIDRVVMLRDARIVGDGPVAQMLTSSSLSELYSVPVQVEERDGEFRLW